jgi:hypothetical protein
MDIRNRGIRAGSRAGFSLLEVGLSATILFLLAGSMIEAVDQVGALGRAGSVEGRMQQGANDALAQVTSDLKQSGFVSASGKDYPHLFEDGDAGVDFANHDHAVPTENSHSGDDDFGVNREIVLVQPTFVEVAQDSTGVNWELYDDEGLPVQLPGGLTVTKQYTVPAIGNDGSAGWQGSEISYVLVTAADGVNELQRRVDGASAQVVARGVERVLFDTATTDPTGCPVDAVRVRVWMRIRDEEGTWRRHSAETVVRLQNGG